MQISVEISLYPLDKDYEKPILDFIERLKRHSGLKIRVNALSTQIEGEYDEVMDVLKKEIKTTFERDGVAINVLKILNKSINL